MMKLKIESINNYNYELIDNEKKYNINIEFFDIKEKPEIGDILYINEKLLNKNYKEYDTFYRFGSIYNSSGRELNKNNEEEVIILNINNKNIILKRLYGW